MFQPFSPMVLLSFFPRARTHKKQGTAATQPPKSNNASAEISVVDFTLLPLVIGYFYRPAKSKLSSHAMALSPQTPRTPVGVDDLQRGVIDHRRLESEIFASWTEDTDNDDEIDEREEKRTLIHCAASQDNAPCVAILLAGGVSCDLQDRFGRTPLHWAAEQGSMSVIQTLGRFGASNDLLSHRLCTPLMLAAERGHEEIVRMLLQARAGATDRHEMGHSHMGWFRSTALHCAAKGSQAGIVGILLGAGFHRGQRDQSGFTAAEVSARQRQPLSPAVTRLLLPVQDGGGQMVFDRVNRVVEDAEILRGLVRGGACVDWQDPIRGETPLHRAVYFNHLKILKILLRAGANPRCRDHAGGSPLHMAAVTGAAAAAEALLRAGAETGAFVMGNYSPLHLAVGNNNLGVVKMLLRAGASVEQLDLARGASPLLWASRLGRTPILRTLLEAGADVNARCASAGLTCLLWACRMTRADSVDALLQAGADLDAVDDTGKNAYSLIGLGEPADLSGAQAVDVEERERLLDPLSTGRIGRALESAKRDRAWCRRGWLVVLATRCGLMKMRLAGSNVKGDRVEGVAGVSTREHPAAVAETTAGRTEMGHGSHVVRQKRSRQQGRAGGYSPGASATVHPDMLNAGHEHDGEVIPPIADALKGMDGIDDVSVELDLTPGRGGDPANDDVVPSPQEAGTAVEALLRVAAVETGVFRHVISFI